VSSLQLIIKLRKSNKKKRRYWQRFRIQSLVRRRPVTSARTRGNSWRSALKTRRPPWCPLFYPTHRQSDPPSLALHGVESPPLLFDFEFPLCPGKNCTPSELVFFLKKTLELRHYDLSIPCSESMHIYRKYTSWAQIHMAQDDSHALLYY
jgi:hypothetical protein